MLGVSKSYEISCHLADNREYFVSQMIEVSPFTALCHSSQNKCIHAGIIIIFVDSYLFLAGGIIMQIFSKTMFLQYFANCEAN